LPRQFELEKISCEEVVRAYLARIEEVIPKLNAVVQFWLKRALIEARNGDEAIARNELPLHGVPITIKDNLDTVASSGGTMGR
jgi:Asp-tRNA(Asn)/Glu-tRNA(Gln) amidotransferase A subunit family amidase